MSIATQRTVELLKAVSVRAEGLTVSEAAAEVQTSVATASRLLQTLVECGAVYRDGPTGRVKITVGMWSIGAAAIRDLHLRRTVVSSVTAALPELGRLAHFGVPGKDKAISVERLDLAGSFVMSTPTGWAIPYHAGTIGKPLLAYMALEERERILCRGLARFTKSTITERKALDEDLAQIRERGFATNRGEFASDGFAVGVAIFDSSGSAVASLSTPAAEDEMNPRSTVVRSLVNLGRSISVLLGYTSHPDSSFV